MQATGIVTYLALALGLGLAGCSHSAAPRVAASGSQPRSAAAPAPTPEMVDGIYKGRAYLEVRLSPACPGSSIGQVEIGDQKLYFAYKPDTMFVAPVQPDGTLHATSGPSLLDGTLKHGRLVFFVRTYVCSSVYVLRRRL